EDASPAPRTLSAEDTEWLQDTAAQRALAIIRRSAMDPAREVLPSDNLELDLGLDSMERVELLVALEKELGADVPESVVSEVYTVRELVDAVRGATRAGAAPAVAGWDSVLATESDDPDVLAIAGPHPISGPAWYLFGRLVNFFTRDRFRLKVTGLEKLPLHGPYIISPNHQSYIDAPVLVSQMPWSIHRELFFVGTSEIFGSGFLRWLARTIKLIPVDPDANLVPAMRAGAFGLRRGKILVLFPEGERSIDGIPRNFKKGAAILSTHMRVPIFPVAVEGFFDALPRGGGFRGFHPLRIAIGDPIYPPPVAAADENGYAQLTQELRSRVVEMWETLRQAPESGRVAADQ
ncbi:MAG TPA: 1-acyl-sn-glycerol-3-phosphate acyltransferase, partial [Terriglobales bacterium]|nr:1-acyl-sn-glycerol-3-phosphate acyltransferase [Terriglobales bacterium]